MPTAWTVREDGPAKLCSSVKRLLILHGYSPDKQPEAIKLLIEQMETMTQHAASHFEMLALQVSVQGNRP
nr:type I restriction enzyme endonuclease domain-containing protein [Corynebacterium hylobatis]